MTRIVILTCCVISLALSCPESLRAEELEITEIDRRIGPQPKYQSEPRYALLILGAESKSPIWIVQDDDRLYIDKNGNRDLTDDGPPTIASEKRFLDKSRWDRKFFAKGWQASASSEIQDFALSQWNYSDPQDQYGLSLKLDGKVPMYAGWTSLLSPSAAEAPVIHFGGPLTPRLLRYKEFVLGAKPPRLSIAFATPRESKLTPARLSIEALPVTIKPTAVIEWPVQEGAKSLTTTHVLTQRCCYWEFYTETFAIPQQAIKGKARVTIIVPHDQFPLELIDDPFEVSVVDQQ
jgi:hypothetical protein